MKLYIAFLLLALPVVWSIKVACVGDSITAGSYPADLQALLGSTYNVTNFGVSGTTVLKNGDSPYWNQPAYHRALASSPDIVVIQFGTNDAKTFNWGPHSADFEPDYTALIKSFQQLASQPTIFISIPPPLQKPVYSMNQTVINTILPGLIRKIASANGLLGPIDIFDAMGGISLLHPDWFADGCHPTAFGYTVLAQTVFDRITQTIVACVGDSITFGVGSTQGNDYPALLQQKLGPHYTVLNLGVSGSTMLKQGDLPYWNSTFYQRAITCSPAYVVIQLGTNDAKTTNWPQHGSQYVPDYTDMIQTFQALKSRPTVFVSIPPPLYKDMVYNIQQEVVNHQLPQFITQIAAANHLAAPIDVFDALGGLALSHPDWFVDGCHPDDAGYDALSSTVDAVLAVW
eukprot:TRINITY_DN1064_c0_g1_i1.p2 TRINITY_DN1064_c0_g1~~TRINITY_DN1064_c0_g1_i1.p2  ORF type:complete len:401 (+),score=96.89 TRINITY_DN1064_c0_g1_i1:30-1232(+)